MKRLVMTLNLVQFLLFCQTRVASSDDWTRFLGPKGRATVENVNVPLDWSADSNIQWKTELPGPGSSSPIVIGNRVFLTCYTGYGVKPAVNIKTSDKTAGDIKKLTRHLVCLDRSTGDIFMGEVPPYSVIVSGTMPGKPLPDGSPGPSLYCAVIVKTVDAQTRSKTGINELLRD